MRSKQRLDKGTLFKAISILVLIAVPLMLGKLLLEEKNPAVSRNKQQNQPSPAELQALAAAVGSPPALTAEQIEEDARIDAEQVALARQWLESADPEQRVDGAEQLAAYPTPDAEIVLIDTLATDPDPQVRSAAAQSLEEFEETTEQAIAALLAALQDESEEVQMSAWATLEGVVSEGEDDSARASQIIAGLKEKVTSPRLAADTREVILEFLQDQSPETP